MNEPETRAAKETILAWMREEGFSDVRVAPAEAPSRSEFLLEWLARGFHATMDYLARDPEGRYLPDRILEGCRSVVCAALDYRGAEDPPTNPSLGRISRYAWGDDYHDVVKEKLERVAERIEHAWPAERARIAVDTSPVLEKPFAARAGLGWIGKHTTLIHPDRGSWFFLGEIFTTLHLAPDPPISDLCGSCTRCIDICPTEAIVAPYILDARRCLSYWNIEHRGPIDPMHHAAMGNWIFGCDLCQEVCPWNRDAARSHEPRFLPRPQNVARSLADWETMPPEEFRERFRSSAVKRARYEGFMRNVAIARRNASGAGESRRGEEGSE